MAKNIGSCRQIRLSVGLNKANMARACGVHRQTWVKWEDGDCQPNAAAVRLMETLLWIKEIGWIENYIQKFVK